MAIERTFKPEDGKVLPCRRGEARTEYLEAASRLRLRVTAAGARTWGVSYYASSVRMTRRLKLGDASRVSLASARKLARKAITEAEAGQDPFAARVAKREEERHRRQERAEARQRARAALPAPTVTKVCELGLKPRPQAA